MKKTIAIDRSLANQLKSFAEKKHGFLYGAICAEAENAIRKHLAEGT